MELFFRRWSPSKPSKSTLILLHGMGGTGLLWRPIAAKLEEKYSIIAPDQRGHGQSQPVPNDDYSPLAYAQDLIDTFKTEISTPCYWVGHSMGVRTAAALAYLKPEWVQGLVLIDLGMRGLSGGTIGPELANFLGRLPDRFQDRIEARAFMEQHCPDPAIGQYLMATLSPNPSSQNPTHWTFPFDKSALQKTIQASQHLSLHPWITEFVQKTNRSVLILRGENSHVYRKETFDEDRKNFERFPKISFETFEGAGHGLPFEKRLEFIDRLQRFIIENPITQDLPYPH